MKDQSLLQQKLLDKVFVYTAETTPPDASDKETLLKNVMSLKGVADAVNVTDSPGAKVTHVFTNRFNHSGSEWYRSNITINCAEIEIV